MTAAILSIGTELLRGEVENTNSTWLCDRISSLGMPVGECAVVGDASNDIRDALRRLAKNHSLVVSTGGLGPTTDDITRDAVAAELEQPLKRDAGSLGRIEARLVGAGRTLSASNARQADFPARASVLDNEYGTAPGFGVDIGGSRAFFFPGVPSEMKPMFERYVVPVVLASTDHRVAQVRLRVLGAAESAVNDLLHGIEEEFGVTIGYRARFPEIEVKALATHAELATAQALARRAADAIRKRLGDLVYGEGDQHIESVVGEKLRARGWTLAAAESCTGGLVSELITRQPASDFFKGAIVCYANEIKHGLLGISEDDLSQHGAVSELVARRLAEGARRVLGADIGVSLTGIAGPTGGSANKPVGLVHFAVSAPNGTHARNSVFRGNRNQIQRRAAYAALNLVREIVTQA